MHCLGVSQGRVGSPVSRVLVELEKMVAARLDADVGVPIGRLGVIFLKAPHALPDVGSRFSTGW